MNRKAWIEALRPRTLPLAVAATGLGSFIAWHEGLASPVVALLSILTAILLQVLSNLANDYGDYTHGADTEERIGPRRAVSSGDISAASMKRAMIVCAVLSFFSGIALLYYAFRGQEINYKVLLFLIAGCLAIAAAIRYTVGKNPYGYRAWGDFAIFIFFGLVAVEGTYYLHTHIFRYYVLLPASAFGLLAAAVLNLNNLRDHDTDKKAGKITLVVKLGRSKALLYHRALIAIAWILLIVYNYGYFSNMNVSYASWLFLLLIPLYMLHLKRSNTLLEINPALLTGQLRQLSLSNLLLVLVFGIGNLL